MGTAQELREKHAQEIRETATAALEAGQRIEINYFLPTVFIDTGQEEYFFQGDEAFKMIEEIQEHPLAELCTPSEILLYQAQYW